MKKSQSAVEFIVLASFMFIVVVGFFAITSSRILEAEEENNRIIANDIAELAYREIDIAKSVNDGYSRVFSMPLTVNGVNYTVKIVDSKELIVDYIGYENVRFLPANVTGDVGAGANRITKINGIIYINNTLCGDDVCEGVESCLVCTRDCGSCPIIELLVRSSIFNVISFNDKGNAILKGVLQQNQNPSTTPDDEFVIRASNSSNLAVINLVTGNMAIKGTLHQNQTLNPSPASNDFIVRNAAGEIVSYINDAGDFYLKGMLAQNGTP